MDTVPGKWRGEHADLGGDFGLGRLWPGATWATVAVGYLVESTLYRSKLVINI